MATGSSQGLFVVVALVIYIFNNSIRGTFNAETVKIIMRYSFEKSTFTGECNVENITYIGDLAFYSSKLTSVISPKLTKANTSSGNDSIYIYIYIFS